MRAVYDALRCRDKTAQAGMLELRKRLSRELTSNQFYRRDRLVALAQKAIDWDAANPRDYDQRWIALYGKVAATSDGSNAGEIFVPEAEWPAILQHVHEAPRNREARADDASFPRRREPAEVSTSRCSKSSRSRRCGPTSSEATRVLR